MRKLIAVALAFIFVGCAATSTLPPAGPSSTPMKKADKILLTVDQSPQEAYQDFAQFLSSKGFGFENTDESLRILKTDVQDYGGLRMYSFSMNVSVLDKGETIIQVSGNTSLGMDSGDYEVKNEGMKDSKTKKIWNKMEEIATSYPHIIDVSYQRN